MIKTHTVIGGRILCESRFPVVQDGDGDRIHSPRALGRRRLPDGARGEQIPIAGRIVAIADAFDAMTHARPYKAALTIEHAVAEIKRCSASQFDPGSSRRS